MANISLKEILPLPEELISLINLYTSHPIADEFKRINHKLDKQREIIFKIAEDEGIEDRLVGVGWDFEGIWDNWEYDDFRFDYTSDSDDEDEQILEYIKDNITMLVDLAKSKGVDEYVAYWAKFDNLWLIRNSQIY